MLKGRLSRDRKGGNRELIGPRGIRNCMLLSISQNSEPYHPALRNCPFMANLVQL